MIICIITGFQNQETKQVRLLYRRITEWNKLYVSFKNSSGSIGKSKRLGCFSSTKCDFLANITMTGLLLVRLPYSPFPQVFPFIYALLFRLILVIRWAKMFLHLFNKQPPDFSTSKFTRLQNNDGRLSMVHFSTVKTLDFFDVWIGVRSSRFAKLKYDLRSRTGLNTIEVIDLRRLLKYSVNKFPSHPAPPSPPLKKVMHSVTFMRSLKNDIY